MKRFVKLAVLIGCATSSAAAQTGTQMMDQVIRSIDARRDAYADVAKQIWSFAEVGYQEEKSSALLQQQLREAGFDVKAGAAGIPTAFVASFGSGKPVIAIVGEFDALPGLSQKALPAKDPVAVGGAGHACGHHLFGTASTAAAVAVKQWLETSKRAGTIRLYGTPAEAGGSVCSKATRLPSRDTRGASAEPGMVPSTFFCPCRSTRASSKLAGACSAAQAMPATARPAASQMDLFIKHPFGSAASIAARLGNTNRAQGV
jgi:hypothetical protein